MKVTNVIFARRKEPQSTLNNVMASVFHPPHFYTLIVRIFHVIEWWVGATQKGCHKRILWLGLVKVTIHDQMMSIPKWYNQLTSCGSFFSLPPLIPASTFDIFFAGHILSDIRILLRNKLHSLALFHWDRSYYHV